MTEEDLQEIDKQSMIYVYQTNFTLTHAVNDYEEAKAFLDEANDEGITDTLQSDITFDSEYGDAPNDFSDKIESVRWSLDTANTGHITLQTNTALTEEEKTYISEWINGQQTQGIGDDFKEEPFQLR